MEIPWDIFLQILLLFKLVFFKFISFLFANDDAKNIPVDELPFQPTKVSTFSTELNPTGIVQCNSQGTVTYSQPYCIFEHCPFKSVLIFVAYNKNYRPK